MATHLNAAEKSFTPTRRPSTLCRKASSKQRQSQIESEEARKQFFTQTAATSNFLRICRDTSQAKSRAYVKDKSGVLYMTLDPKMRYITDPIIEVTAQNFKDNFSGFSALVKNGMAFRLSLRGSEATLYVRPHTKYRNPLGHIIEKWRDGISRASSTKKEEDRLVTAIRSVESGGKTNSAEVLKALRELKLGIARLAIGHRPFEEGELPKNGYSPDEEEPK